MKTLTYLACFALAFIGHRFQCGHQVLIRAEVTIGDRCVVHHQCTLEGRLPVGDEKFYPMPDSLAGGNLPELLLPQTDLFGAHHDDSWKHESMLPR